MSTKNPGLRIRMPKERFDLSRYIHFRKDSPGERIINGIYFENPVFMLALGMCPTLATTTSVMNAVGMGLSTTAILTMSNLFISLLRKVIPERMRMPSYIVIIASFVTIVDFLMEGFTPEMYKSLGVYIPLIVVNCIIMGRAEAYAGKNRPLAAMFDGVGMGLGFTAALILVASVRELLGSGTWAGIRIMPPAYEPISIFVLAPGAFLVLAMFVAVMNRLHIGVARREDEWDPTGRFVCGDCRSCPRVLNCGGKPAEEVMIPHTVYDTVGPMDPNSEIAATVPKADSARDKAAPVPEEQPDVQEFSGRASTMEAAVEEAEEQEKKAMEVAEQLSRDKEEDK